MSDAAPRSSRFLLSRLWRAYLYPSWPWLLLNLGLIALVSAATGSYPLLINWAFERFQAQDRGSLAYVPLLVIVATTVKGAALYSHLSLTNSILSRLIKNLQECMYQHLLAGDFSVVARVAPAALAQRFTTDLTYIREAASRIITTLVRDMLTCVVLVGSMFWLDWQLALVALVILPLAIWPVAAIGQSLRRVAKRTQAEMGEMNASVTESLAGIRMIKSYQLETYMQGRMGVLFEALHRLRVKAANQRARVEPVMEILGGLAVAGVLALIGWRLNTSTASLGEFTGFVSALLLAAQPMRALGNFNVVLQEGLAATERVFELLDTPPRVVAASQARDLEVTQGEVRFDAVGFRYDPCDDAVLEDVSFAVARGQTLALVGRSGAGKSTLFHLVPRLFDVTAGRILIDGQDVRDVSLSSLRSQVAVVSQDAVVFNDTASANIGFGRLGASRAEIESAAAAAAAHDFILALPEGYDTVLGTAGTRLSGGQRQRLALARAILKDAPLLLLDEATSALDAESESLVQQALARLKAGRTTLVIAHRLSTVQDADQILVLDQGRVVQQGTHAMLMQQAGLYQMLYRLQFREDNSLA